MTEPDDHSSTRPISVAELLAKNGSIGSPPVGGRRRRRRGDTDSVTVAELTGEIPIVDESTHFADLDAADSDAEHRDAEHGDGSSSPAAATNGATIDDFDGHRADHLDDHDADYEDHLRRREVVADPVEFAAPARRPSTPPSSFGPAGGAEQMSPDPMADDVDDFGPDEDLIRSLEGREPLSSAQDVEFQADEVPSYLRSDPDTLFSGQTVADDLARRGRRPGPEDIDLESDEPTDGTESAGGRPTDSALLRGVWAVAQSLLAVIFGAVLFVAFELLWKWNNVVALVLAVLVILGLVAGVRVIRKTEDIGSTLIAVAVGALVTFGPAALLAIH